jgi:hypothetical protein
MTKFLSSQRFLVVYSGCLTVIFLVTVLCGFAKVEQRKTFDDIASTWWNQTEPFA